MALSYWEIESFQQWDFIVVGSGIVGLSAAINLKERHPMASVLVLEQGLLPTGASTKNAGFACFGSLTELVADMAVLGEERCLELVKKRWYGLQKLRQRTGDLTIDYQQKGGFELITEKEADRVAEIDRVNELLARFFGIKVFREDKVLVDKFGFNKSVIKTVVANPLEGQLHTGKMIRELIKIATAKGVHIITGCKVRRHQEHTTQVELDAVSLAGEELTFKASMVAFCTNAFASKYFPELDIRPGRGLVFVTEEMEKVPFEGAFHMQEGYYYFRNAGNRILFGGGRNLDFEGETTPEFGINERILAELKRLLVDVLVPQKQLQPEHVWSGIMAFGETKEPIVRLVSPRVAVGVRLGGMGVAIGSLVGEELAEILWQAH